MQKLILLLSLISSTLIYCQNKDEIIYPNFKNTSANTILRNKNWKILKEAKGYLNKDKITDFVFVLESTNKNHLQKNIYDKVIENTYPRIILVLVNDKVIIQNNSFIAKGNEGGMLPVIEPDVSIKNNQLSIYWQYLRGNTEYIFQYKSDSMFLVKAKRNYVQSASGNFEFSIYDFLRKEVSTETGNISKTPFKTKVASIKLEHLKKLSEFEEMYDWEVVKGKYL